MQPLWILSFTVFLLLDILFPTLSTIGAKRTFRPNSSHTLGVCLLHTARRKTSMNYLHLINLLEGENEGKEKEVVAVVAAWVDAVGAPSANGWSEPELFPV